jgi:DNA-binding CsgD family transcriptional regulator
VRAIAERLFLNAKTVANLQSSVRQKLGADTAARLVHIAAQSGLLRAGE